jgi:putative membrane protein
LIVSQGVGEVFAALSVAGWGLLGVAAFHLVPLAGDALGWRALLRTRQSVPLRVVLYGRWIGESVNGLLPVAQVGGSVVKATLLSRRGVPGPFAGASVVVDVTTLVATQIGFTLFGIALLMTRVGGGDLAPTAAAGAMLMSLLLLLFYLSQRRGLFGVLAGALRRLAPDGAFAWRLSDGARTLDQEVSTLYGQGAALTRALAWHALAWLVGAGEVWLALRLLGHPVDLSQALLLESLGQAIRAAAFAIPGALGVQEGGYLMLGALLGIGPETSLALSLTKRVRELTLGIPGLVVWQIEEANALLGDRSGTPGALEE